MAVSWITALKVIPWGDVVQNAPAVLRGAKKLWSTVRQAPEPHALEQEVAQLKEQAESAARLISSLAEQNARLVEAVDLLRMRTRVLLVVCSVLVVAMLTLAAFVVLR
jgi:hypothetical protein